MKQEFKDSLSLSANISKYPLICTALICLFCACFSQEHQVSYYTVSGVNGEFGLLPAVPGMVLSAVLIAAFAGIVRAGEGSKAKRALYISAGFGAVFLCWRGLLSANALIFDVCMLLIAVATAALCFYFFAKHSLVSTALAASAVLALGLSMGYSFLLYAFAVLVFALVILADSDVPLIKRIIAVFALIITALLVPVLYSTAETKASGVFVAGVLVCIGGYLVSELRGKSKIPAAVMLMFGLGLVMRLGYVFDIALPANQHDVFSVFNTTHPRHNSYIMYIYQNWSLPTESVYGAGLSQYYHPPLYHFLAAVWMKAQTLCGIELYAAYENIQYFTMFCSAAMMAAGYKLFLEFKLKGLALYTAFAVLAFHPTFYIFAGSVNNDPLTTLLLFLAVLSTVRWYKEQSFKNTLLLALTIGGAMLTKLSGAMVALGTAYVMLSRLFSRETGGFVSNFKRLWSRFLVFGAVCFPLGLWWPIRCAIKFGMPLGYVPSLSVDNVQYVGNYSLLERLTGIGSWSLSNMYPNVGGTMMDGSAVASGASSFFDYGIAPYIVKSSLFGEYFYKTSVSGAQDLLAYVMVFSAIALIGISLYSMFKAGIRTKGEMAVPVRFLLVYYLALVGSYVLFCFRYPHTCTMDFRYIVPTLLIGAVFTGMLINGDGKKQKALKAATFALTMVFSVSSVVFYAMSY